MKFYRDDPELIDVLRGGSQDDLAVLVDIITDNGKGRIALDHRTKALLMAAKEQNAITGDVLIYLAEEIQKFGANTLISLFRGGSGVIYKEIACDVARRVKANHNLKQDIATVEGAVLLKVLEKALEKMTEEEKGEFFAQFGVNYTGAGPAAMAALLAAIRASGFYAYQVACIVANSVAKLVVGRGLNLGANAALTRVLAVAAGPIGWVISVFWTVLDIASPACRVTIPCVIQIAYMRQKALLIRCPVCHAQISVGAKFCSECGHGLPS